MRDKLNDLLYENNIKIWLDLEWIRNKLTKGSIRERHLAKALRIKIQEYGAHDKAKIKPVLEQLFGKPLKSPVENHAGVENEIRAQLLKAGGSAFVPEDAKAFLPMQTVCDIILAAGGIPTYPFLADDANGAYTNFENDLERVAGQLTERNFHSVEFITTRNDLHLLEKYAVYLHEQGFVVTFGSEHNTPAMEPIELFARNGMPLTETLLKITYEGACVIGAHQHLVKQGLPGYVDEKGKADRLAREEFVALGEKLIVGS
jgi:hypothetical protein